MKTIFDVGMHKGEDTEYYLARGFRVVAVEANPDLISFCREKFSSQLAMGQLEIVHGAIADEHQGSDVIFFQNVSVSEWGTVSPEWARRNSSLGANSRQIRVPVVKMANLFEKYGCPHYLKIDIEGMDLVCLRELLDTSYRPNFVSIESEKKLFSELIAEFDVLAALGYSHFYVKQQAVVQHDSVPADSTEGKYVDFRFSEESSGLFGTDLRDSWMTRDEALAIYKKIFRLYLAFGDDSLLRKVPFGGRVIRGLAKITQKPLPGWYDTHAALR